MKFRVYKRREESENKSSGTYYDTSYRYLLYMVHKQRIHYFGAGKDMLSVINVSCELSEDYKAYLNKIQRADFFHYKVLLEFDVELKEGEDQYNTAMRVRDGLITSFPEEFI